jgi:hypothetical protein
MRELFGKRYAARSHRPHLACRHVGLPQIVARLGVPDRSLVANSQFVAAFRAAPRQNCPAILARHASTETMSLRPFAVIGLKCTFWHLGSIATGRRAPVARPCTIMDSAFSIHEPDVGQDGILRPIGNRPPRVLLFFQTWTTLLQVPLHPRPCTWLSNISRTRMPLPCTVGFGTAAV